MCFFIHPKHPEVKTAKRDIPCYKEGFRLRDFFYPIYHSSYRYSLGQLHRIAGEWPALSPALTAKIYEGFHSFSNKKRLSRRHTRAKCIIPKGAHYFYNPEDREYVSDQIIIQEFID